jgi:hypothetical protein
MRAAKLRETLTLDEPLTPLHPAEERFIRYMREFQYGSLTVKIVAGLPVLIEHQVTQVKLT